MDFISPNRIREIRKEKNMTLSDIALKAGISVPYLSDIERGNRKGSPTVLSWIADALEVDVSELTKKVG